MFFAHFNAHTFNSRSWFVPVSQCSEQCLTQNSATQGILLITKLGGTEKRDMITNKAASTWMEEGFKIVRTRFYSNHKAKLYKGPVLADLLGFTSRQSPEDSSLTVVSKWIICTFPKCLCVPSVFRESVPSVFSLYNGFQYLPFHFLS